MTAQEPDPHSIRRRQAACAEDVAILVQDQEPDELEGLADHVSRQPLDHLD
ncbi:hypothetical protein TEK04_16955 [Klenkia sp. LSe6-5]|uniref:Uncharacterized protein n=1 Tax=Klenkia sesuvii TaxID=3103137 RepID=A0ABU8DX40_9ACTN